MLIVALAIRLAVMAFLYPQQLDPARDHWSFGFEEGRVARSIAEGKGFSSPLYADTGPTAWIAPVYPMLLAGVFKVFGVYSKASALVILSLNSLFSALTCLPIFFFARRSFDERTALWAGWIWTVLPYAVFFPIDRIWDTWLTTLLLSVLFLIVLKMERSTSLVTWIGFGFISGIAALTSPVVLAALPPLALWACYRLHRQGKRWLAPAAASVLVVVAVMAPWFVRNYRVLHAFIPVSDSLGLEFRMGNNGDTSHLYSIKAGPWDQWYGDVEWKEYMHLGEYAYMQRKGQQAFAFIGSHRAWYARTILRRIVNTWTSLWNFDGRDFREDPFGPVTAILCTVLSGLTFWGLWRAFREEGINFATPYTIVLLLFPIVYYLTHTGDWYRRPIDPMMVVLAVYAFTARKKIPIARPQ
jgi:4-amino-4-deoxy-L-arabinose transferase-like glycosyltransferase